jgi:hypothetical protein
MSFLAYLLAVVLLALFVMPLAIGVRSVRRRVLPGWSGPPAWLLDIVAWLSAVVVLSELLGSVGLFRAWALVIASALSGLVLAALSSRFSVRTKEAPRAPADGGATTRWVAYAAALAVLGQWAVPAQISLTKGMTAPDTLWYHGPFAARFVQEGWLTHLHFVEVEPLTAYYPANSELLHAVGIALFDSHDVLSPLLNLGFVALALLAGWCIGRPFGAAPLSMLGTSIALSLPILWGVNAGQAGNDAAGLAFFLAAAALLVNGAAAGSGAAAGLALGTKFSLVGPALAVVAVRPRVRAVVALALTGGFWFVRNLVQTGWFLPRAPRPLTEHLEFSLAHYLTDWPVWRSHLLPGLHYGFGSVWPLVLFLAAAGACGALFSRGPRRALGVVAIAAALLYVFTPNSAAGRDGDPWSFGLNLRYATPAVALGLALLPTWVTRWRTALTAVLGATLLITLRSPTGLYADRRLEALGIAAVLALVVTLAATRPRLRPVLAIAALIALFPIQSHYLDNRYKDQPLKFAHGLTHSRIGVLGATTHYALYGDDLSNRVVYVGRSGPRGAFTREPDCRAWRNAVNAGHFDYLLVAPVSSPDLPAETPTQPPIEARWTDGDPAAVPIQRVGRLVTVYRLKGPLDPSGCVKQQQ